MKRTWLKKPLALSLSVLLSLSLFVPLTASAAGNTYYISPTGSDGNVGSIAAPFRTIAHAKTVLQPGDTCVLRGGIYHESVDLSGLYGTDIAEINICAYEGESVVFSPTAAVSGWSRDTVANIWVASFSGTVDVPVVLQGGSMMTPARWPNLTEPDVVAGGNPILNNANYARIDSGNQTAKTFVDAALSGFTADTIVGSTLWCGAGVNYYSFMLNITAYNEDTQTVTYEVCENTLSPHPVNYRPCAYTTTISNPDSDAHENIQRTYGNIYYLTGKKDYLDAEGEYYIEDGNLYLYATATPQNVEVQTKETALTFGNATYVNVSGITLRGGEVSFGTAKHCSLLGSTVSAVSTAKPNPGNSVDTNGQRYGDVGKVKGQNVTLSGTYNTMHGCEVFDINVGGVTVTGSNNRLLNCYVHDVDLAHSGTAGVSVNGKSHLASHNTVTRSGRSAFSGKFDACELSYNDLSDSNRLSWDSGLLYIANNNFNNTELHHNVLHDDLNGDPIMRGGLYFDSFTTGMVVYNNLVYNIENVDLRYTGRNTQQVNPNSRNNLFINNTFVNLRAFQGLNLYDGLGDRSGTIMVNNLYARDCFTGTPAGITLENNLTNFSDWTDAANANFVPLADSAADGTGVSFPGIHENGETPSIGAFNVGETPWVAGHDFSKDYTNETCSISNSIPARNLMQNGDFETVESKTTDGTTTTYPTEWTLFGNAGSCRQSSWGYWSWLTKDGSYALQLSQDGDAAEQVISGLLPNTAYEISGYGMQSSKHFVAYGFSRSSSSSIKKVECIDTLGTDDWLEYVAEVRNKPYDEIIFNFRNAPAASAGCYITIHEGPYQGDIDAILASDPIATIPVSKTGQDAVGRVLPSAKFYYTIPGSDWTNKNWPTLVFKFHGDFSGAKYYGFVLNNTESTDTLTMRAASDSGEMKELAFNARDYDLTAPKMVLHTGDEGQIRVIMSKTGNNLIGRFDCVEIKQVYNPEAESAAITAEYEVKDEDNNLIYGINTMGSHVFSGTVQNNSGSAVSVTLSAYNADHSLKGTPQTVTASDGTFNVSYSGQMTKTDYFTLHFDNGTDVADYIISDLTLEKQYNGASDVFLKNVSVTDEDGNLAAVTPGAFRYIEMTVVNSVAVEKPMTACLATYSSNDVLLDVVELERSISPKARESFAIGTVLPNEAGSYVKFFLWANEESVQPYVEEQTFYVQTLQ